MMSNIGMRNPAYPEQSVRPSVTQIKKVADNERQRTAFAQLATHYAFGHRRWDE